MRRVIFVFISVASFVVGTGAPSALADPSRERVAGSFSQGPGHRVVISAAGDPGSESASGFVTNRIDPQTLFYEMRVTCMFVDGNHAVIGGEITASDLYPGHVGTGLVFEVVDVAEPGRGADQAGHSFNTVPQPLPGTDCPAPTVLGPAFVVGAGNVQVFGG